MHASLLLVVISAGPLSDCSLFVDLVKLVKWVKNSGSVNRFKLEVHD